MQIRSVIFCLISLCSGVLGAFGNKTVVDILPHIPTPMCLNTTMVTHDFNSEEVKNVRKLECKVLVDYLQSVNGNVYGRDLSPFYDNDIRIGTYNLYDKKLNEFSFIHDQTLTPGIDATLSLHPFFKKTTIMGEIAFPLDKYLRNCFLTISLNYKTMNYGINIGLEGPHVSRDVDGTVAPLSDYFKGNIKQKNAEIQSPLREATFGETHHKTGLGDVVTAFGWDFEGVNYFESFGIKMRLAFNNKRDSAKFMDLPLSDFPSTTSAFFTNTTFLMDKIGKLERFLHLGLEIGSIWGQSEERVLGFKDAHLSLVPWSPFLLLAQKNVAGVFPAANILTATVSPESRFYFTLTWMVNFHYSIINFAAGFNVIGFQKESGSFRKWWWGEYAVPSDSYNSLNPFGDGGAGDFAYGANAYIPSTGIDIQPALSEGFLAEKLNLMLSISPTVKGIPVQINVGASYTIPSYAVEQAWSVSSGIFLSF